MNNPLLEEIYAVRDQLWKEAGETVAGLFALYSRPVSGVSGMPFKQCRTTRARTRRVASRHKNKTPIPTRQTPR